MDVTQSQASTGTPLQDEPRIKSLDEKLREVREAREKMRREKGIDPDTHPLHEFDEQLEIYDVGSPIRDPPDSPDASGPKTTGTKTPTGTKDSRKTGTQSEQRTSREKSAGSEQRKRTL